MWLWDVPRGQIKDILIKKSAGLPKNPGAGFKGECDLFQAPKRGDAEPSEIPVCMGICKGAVKCHLAIVAWEGRHSDVYDVAVFCTCMTEEELTKWARAKGGQVINLGK
jgi:hypothetical protein